MGDACWGSPPWELPFPVSSRHFPPSTALTQDFCVSGGALVGPACAAGGAALVAFTPAKARQDQRLSRFCESSDRNLKGRGALSVSLQCDTGIWQILEDSGIWQR